VFDIAFSEIVVIAVVALVVIGPERLPKVAKTLGHMFGRLQRYVNDVKADISREMELDELRKLQSEVQSAARDLESSVTNAAREVESGVRSVETQLNEAANPPALNASAVEAAEAEAAAAVGTPADQASAAAADALPPVSPEAPAHPATADSPRQGALPGFDRI
jgi:sec-independent protein translocase protein TatB